jgi:3',5'-cyclic AMP phosphodiesterase CpdA
MRWIDSCLTNSKSRWKIVVGHHPVYSSGSGHGKETGDMETRFAKFFDKKGVDAYFCGHDHDFEYIKNKDSKVNYFVCGTGSEVRPMSDPLPSTVFAKSVPGFTKVLLTPVKMKVTMIDTAGTEIYTTEIEKK